MAKNNEDIISKEEKAGKVKTVKIKKGWTIETVQDKSSQSIVAKKKFFNPINGGFSSGEIVYSIYKSKKHKNGDDIELEDG